MHVLRAMTSSIGHACCPILLRAPPWMQVTGLDHMALAASLDDVVELDDENAISQRPNHYSFRTDFLRAALDRLSCVQTGAHKGRLWLVPMAWSCTSSPCTMHLL